LGRQSVRLKNRSSLAGHQITAKSPDSKSAAVLFQKLYPDEHFDADSADELADLITRFVVGGMRALKLPAK
jgi:hypothetical protein